MVAPGEQVFGKYEVLRRLAVGGMGEIFLSRQVGIVDRLVILKSLLPQMASDQQAFASFLDEARILASINHPNVVALYEVGEWDGTHFIAMEYINGIDVNNLLKHCQDNKKRLPPLVTAQIVREAAMGLDSAHLATDATGSPLHVVHRDISPHNIMVRSDGHTKVVDFGVALAENRLQKTEVGMLKGKLGYLSPEQIKGIKVEPKADQFSLGVLLWEMLTQRRLFTGDNAGAVFTRILKDQPVAPSSLVSDVGPEMDAVVLRMLSQEPVDRFPRLADTATALRRVLEQYKSPDNAVAQFIRSTVGPELIQRLKELAVRPPPTLPIPGTAGSGSGSGSVSGSVPAPPLLPSLVCGVCGTSSPAADRFCRSCGSNIGTGTVKRQQASSSGTPSIGTPRSNTGPVARGGVSGVASTPSGAARPDAADSGDIDPVPSTPKSIPRAEPRPQPKDQDEDDADAPTEQAVVAGVVEVLRHGEALMADEVARTAAFAIIDDLAMRHNSVAEKSENGRFFIALSGEGSTLTAVSLARSSVRDAARAGHDVIFRLAVVSEALAAPADIPRLSDIADQLVDNAASGSAVIADGVRLQGGDPPITRSVQVTLRDGDRQIIHELHLPQRLIGRTAQITEFHAALDQVEQESTAVQIMLLGEGGVGKSALLEVAMLYARDRGFLCGHARGARVKEALALDVLRQLVKGVCLDVLGRERLTGAWTRAVDICGLAPAYAARLKAVIDDDGDVALRDVPAVRRRAVLKAAILAFFQKLTDRGPVILVVDDYHRCDPQSLEILTELGVRLRERRLGIIFAGRPLQDERTMPQAKRILLPGLPASDIVAVASQLLGSPVIEPLAAHLVSRSLGNPLMLTILLRHLIAQRVIAPSSGGVQVLVDLERVGLSSNTTVIIHANHATLSADAQALLVAAAHIGQVIDPAQLVRVIDSVRDIDAVLASLVDSGILEPLPTVLDSPDRWVFKSTVEFETIPARLDPSQARLLQLRVADALQKDLEERFSLEVAERLASHLFAADSRQKGAEIAARAADRAAALGLFDVAAEHYKRALKVEWRGLAPGPGAEEKASRVLRTAAFASQCLLEFDPHAAVEILAPVLKSLPPTIALASRVEALKQRGLALARLKRFSEAEQSLDEALETHSMVASAGSGAGLLVDLAAVLEQSGDVDGAINQLEEAVPRLANVQPSPLRDRAYDALLLLGRLRLRQRKYAPARAAFVQAVEEAKNNRRGTAEAEARALLGALWQAEGDLDSAVTETKKALRHAEGVGDPILEARLRQQLGRALVALGRSGDAATVLQQAVDCARLGQWDDGASAAEQLLAIVAR